MTRSAIAIHGSLLGTIVGDAMGLPYEALSRRRGTRLLGQPDRHRFFFQRGMMSDDGEHACMVAQCLCEYGGDVDRFQTLLARRLRWWLLGVPAGIGLATLRSILKLWLGVNPRSSGVFSAGNGPAMRSVVIGAAIEDPAHLRDLVLASTRITHTDPKAFYGAIAAAMAARCSANGQSGETFLERTRTALAEDEGADELLALLSAAVKSAATETTTSFADSIGCTRGASGYIYKTVPVAIHAWRRNPSSFSNAVSDAIRCGGDTDTVAAITGGIVGAGVGVDRIPLEWRSGLLEWPRNAAWIAKLAEAATSATSSSIRVTPPTVGPTVLLRNAFFILIIAKHLIRRALPPY